MASFLSSRPGRVVVVVAQCALLAVVLSYGLCAEAGSVRANKSLQFSFYLHQLLDPNNFTAIVGPPVLGGILAPGNNAFGSTTDNPLTKGLELDSKLVDRAKGTIVFDNNNLENAGSEQTWAAVFNEASGFVAGTTLSYHTFDDAPQVKWEVSISTGTDKFRLARGWAVRENFNTGTPTNIVHEYTNYYGSY